MSSGGQILILMILPTLSDELMDTYFFDSLIGISILNISVVPPTDHIQTLAPLSFSKNPLLFLLASPLTRTVPPCAHQIRPEIGTLSPIQALTFFLKKKISVVLLFGCIRSWLWCVGSKARGLSFLTRVDP